MKHAFWMMSLLLGLTAQAAQGPLQEVTFGDYQAIFEENCAQAEGSRCFWNVSNALEEQAGFEKFCIARQEEEMPLAEARTSCWFRIATTDATSACSIWLKPVQERDGYRLQETSRECRIKAEMVEPSTPAVQSPSDYMRDRCPNTDSHFYVTNLMDTRYGAYSVTDICTGKTTHYDHEGNWIWVPWSALPKTQECPTADSHSFRYNPRDKSHGAYSVTDVCTGETRHYTRGGKRLAVR